MGERSGKCPAPKPRRHPLPRRPVGQRAARGPPLGCVRRRAGGGRRVGACPWARCEGRRCVGGRLGHTAAGGASGRGPGRAWRPAPELPRRAAGRAGRRADADLPLEPSRTRGRQCRGKVDCRIRRRPASSRCCRCPRPTRSSGRSPRTSDAAARRFGPHQPCATTQRPLTGGDQDEPHVRPSAESAGTLGPLPVATVVAPAPKSAPSALGRPPSRSAATALWRRDPGCRQPVARGSPPRHGPRSCTFRCQAGAVSET